MSELPCGVVVEEVRSLEQFKSLFQDPDVGKGNGRSGMEKVLKGLTSSAGRLSAWSIRLLLCYDEKEEKYVSKAYADGFLKSLVEELKQLRSDDTWRDGISRLEGVHLWNGTHFPEAMRQLEKVAGQPLLLVIQGGEIVDRFDGPVYRAPSRSSSREDVAQNDGADGGHSSGTSSRDSAPPLLNSETMRRFCERLMAPQLAAVEGRGTNGPITSTAAHHTENTRSQDPGSRLTVNVANLVELGCKTMRSGKAVYAEKIFGKALETLDAVTSETLKTASWSSLSDFYGTMASVLAWMAMARLVQGKEERTNPYMTRLLQTEMLKPWREQPLTDVARAIALSRLVEADIHHSVPSTSSPSSTQMKPWCGEDSTCSQRYLLQFLSTNPNDISSRRKLVITLFLAGDLERCLTEVMKLKSLKDDCFSEAAMASVCDFCGQEHPLVEALGLDS